ncbi:MAG: hypothetical protein DWI02_01990 [Planctomycetota bacterium]|jgi:hypothetical protein|nr:MAG: hypothetical protein DWI02_01990 [Planctomycetota bacterium]
MNIWGKVLAFLVVIAAIFASIFSAKLVQVRNSWTRKSITSKNKFDELKPKIETVESQIRALNSELFLAREFWGAFLADVQTAVKNPADGSVEVNIGSDKGLQDHLLMHGFEIAEDGTSTYRGSFLPIKIENDRALMKPNWRATSAEVKTWKPGNWRWRNQLPPGYAENFDKQLTAILKLEETRDDRLRTLEGQKKLRADADRKLKQREAELIGGEELPKSESIAPEFRDGLVAAMAQVEEERNQTLLNLDKLRRQVRSVQGDIERLLQENQDLADRLPKPETSRDVTQAK